MEIKNVHDYVKAPLLERIPVSYIIGRHTLPSVLLGFSKKELRQYNQLLPPDISQYYRESRNLTRVVVRRNIETEIAATHVGGIEVLQYILGVESFSHYLTEEQTLRIEKVTALRGTKIDRRW